METMISNTVIGWNLAQYIECCLRNRILAAGYKRLVLYVTYQEFERDIWYLPHSLPTLTQFLEVL